MTDPADAASTRRVEVISFGYGHGGLPEAHLTVDVRAHFKDPHVTPALRNLTAADAQVVQAVMDTPGVAELTVGMLAAVQAFRVAPSPAPITVAVGCVGGRHRSAVIAADLAAKLRDVGAAVTLTHRDIGRPVIASAERRATVDELLGADPDWCGGLSVDQYMDEQRQDRYPESAPAVTVYGPHCSHDDCSWITCGETGLVEFPCSKPGCPHCGAPAATEQESWAGDPARVAAMSPEDRERVAAYLARYPLVSRGPDDSCERLRLDDDTEPDDDEDYDPGPEIDDEGGMSEYRSYQPEPWQ